MFTLEQIQNFQAVYETGSYSLAAKYLNKSRTSVRDRILGLEEQLGENLFNIKGKKAEPTILALHLYRRATNIVRQAEEFELIALSVKEHDLMEVVFYHDALIPTKLIATIDQCLFETFPHLTVHWIQQGREGSMKALEKGTAHFAFMPSLGKIYPSDGVGYTNLGQLNLGIYAGINSPLAKLPTVTIGDLSGNTQLICDVASRGSSPFGSLSNQQHFVTSKEVLVQLLEFRGWAVFNKANAQVYVNAGQIIELDLEEILHNFPNSLVLFHAFTHEQNRTQRVITSIIKKVALKVLS